MQIQDKIQSLKHTPIFFILGRSRSGTTLLRTMFDAHPNISIPLEARFIQLLYPKYHKISHWDKNTMDMFCKDLLAVSLIEFWKLDENYLKQKLYQLQGENSFANISKFIYTEFSQINSFLDVQ